MSGWVAGVLLGLLVAACGGQVKRNGDPEDPSAGEQGVEDGPSPGDGDYDPDHSVELPDCDLGQPIAEVDVCNYVVDDRCYDDKASACGCACPEKNSVCTSGFPQENGRVEVFCD